MKAAQEDHPDSRLLERFMRDEAAAPERLQVVRHLLTGCARCAVVTRRLWSFGEEPTQEPLGRSDLAVSPGYGGMFQRLAERAVHHDRQARADTVDAPLRFAELLLSTRASGLARIRGERGLQTPAVCELLIGESQLAAEPAAAVARGEWAVAVAERIDPGHYGASLVRSLRGRSWAWLGDALRLAGDLRRAEEVLTRAEAPIEEGLDPLEGAELLELKARLRADLGKPAEAEPLFDRALALYRALGERHLQARVLVQQGTVRGWGEENDTEPAEKVFQGIQLLRQGRSLLDEPSEPALVAFACHRLALLLAEAGQAKEALLEVRRARAVYEQCQDRPNLVRLRHLEGKIAAAQGMGERAEAAFVEARQGFLLEGLGVEAATVLFDLAILYTRARRTPEIRQLAEELLPIFQARDIRQGVVAALLVFRRLAETGHATIEALAPVHGYVAGPARARRPALR